MRNAFKTKTDYIFGALLVIAALLYLSFFRQSSFELFFHNYFFLRNEVGQCCYHNFIFYKDGNATLMKVLPYAYGLLYILLLAIYGIVFRLDRFKKVNGILSLIAFIVYFFFFQFFPLTSIETYIRVGDYLRDMHGINIYSMDWGRTWITSMGPLEIIIMALGMRLIFQLIIFVRQCMKNIKRTI